MELALSPCHSTSMKTLGENKLSRVQIFYKIKDKFASLFPHIRKKYKDQILCLGGCHDGNHHRNPAVQLDFQLIEKVRGTPGK